MIRYNASLNNLSRGDTVKTSLSTLYCLSASDKVIATTAIRLSIKTLTTSPYFHTKKLKLFQIASKHLVHLYNRVNFHYIENFKIKRYNLFIFIHLHT